MLTTTYVKVLIYIPEDNSLNDLLFCLSFVPFRWHFGEVVKLSLHFLVKNNVYFYILLKNINFLGECH